MPNIIVFLPVVIVFWCIAIVVVVSCCSHSHRQPPASSATWRWTSILPPDTSLRPRFLSPHRRTTAHMPADPPYQPPAAQAVLQTPTSFVRSHASSPVWSQAPLTDLHHAASTSTLVPNAQVLVPLPPTGGAPELGVTLDENLNIVAVIDPQVREYGWLLHDKVVAVNGRYVSNLSTLIRELQLASSSRRQASTGMPAVAFGICRRPSGSVAIPESQIRGKY